MPQRVAVQGWAEISIGLGIGPDDVELVAGPLFHGLGFTCALQQLYVGGSLVIHRRFDARAVLDSIARDRTTIVPGVPVIFDRILAELEPGAAGADTSPVRLVMTSGARAGGTLKRRLAGAFRWRGHLRVPGRHGDRHHHREPGGPARAQGGFLRLAVLPDEAGDPGRGGRGPAAGRGRRGRQAGAC